ncbi:discoidin domain-containing protein [Ktedonospora formicarum]|uniref:F5/8 type C domain-containing protein n=1 Tax=Ktedonospora formicarum TaxID=2778364 RepID=A0A8J3HWP6_9CHLR|nr:discoidin domain-containing protein [Ktedonospora formicarum]GHO42067.1 hypothetical protein KSX_02300 [Ktedonospora formicarum]
MDAHSVGSQKSQKPVRRLIGIFMVLCIMIGALIYSARIPTAYAATSQALAGCGTTNIALNKPTTASSIESASWPASAANDGNVNTRWGSAFSDPQWLQIDLGSSQTICQVVLQWEAAYATAYQIQVSNDASNWTTIYTTTTGTGECKHSMSLAQVAISVCTERSDREAMATRSGNSQFSQVLAH